VSDNIVSFIVQGFDQCVHYVRNKFEQANVLQAAQRFCGDPRPHGKELTDLSSLLTRPRNEFLIMFGCKKNEKRGACKGVDSDKQLYQDNPSYALYFNLASLSDEGYGLFQQLCMAANAGNLAFLTRPRPLGAADFKVLQGCREVWY
jgi:hypothetical protein